MAVLPAVLIAGPSRPACPAPRPHPLQVGGAAPKVAVAELSLAVGAREAFGLLGPNGAGKTTTLRIMQGERAGSTGSPPGSAGTACLPACQSRAGAGAGRGLL